ncbi:hypothetical protein SLS55_008447 [Diplodia seriata]|uniref:Rhodopsin domain-containing protein n=1 Tax=Diplodia seriata TaxID=420778 RepID=A0ABR3C5Z3_9PEZI
MSENKGPSALATCVAITCVSAAIVLTRLWIRVSIVRASGWDDWIITIACNFWLSIIFYNIALGLTKTSILMQYLRIFATHKAMRIAILTTLTFIILYTLEAIVLSIFTCTPVNRFWNRTLAGTCVDTKGLWFAHAAINIFSDTVIIVLPMPVFKGLNLPTKQKIALMAIFALGAFGAVTSILRLQSLYAVADSADQSYDNVNAAVWSNVEINVAIICASLPTFKALVKRLFPHLLSTDPASRSPAGAGHTSGATGGSKWGRSRGGTRLHGGTLISMDCMERGEGGGGAGKRERGGGGFTTTIEKGSVVGGGGYGGEASDGESGHSSEGIKVTTVVSQREDAGSDKNMLYADDVHSISESERKFFPHS